MKRRRIEGREKERRMIGRVEEESD